MKLLTKDEARKIVDEYIEKDQKVNSTQDIINSGEIPELEGFKVQPGKVNLMKFMPFLVSENLMMDAITKGADSGEMHEIVRTCMLEARYNIDNGRENNMLELLHDTGKFHFDLFREEEILQPEKYVGRSREQVDEFGEKEVKPIQEKYKEFLGQEGQVQV